MCYLRQLSSSDGREVYMLLQHIGLEENAFTNPVKVMSYEEFKRWLVQQDNWSKNIDLPQGYLAYCIIWAAYVSGATFCCINNDLPENYRRYCIDIFKF